MGEEDTLSFLFCIQEKYGENLPNRIIPDFVKSNLSISIKKKKKKRLCKALAVPRTCCFVLFSKMLIVFPSKKVFSAIHTYSTDKSVQQ